MYFSDDIIETELRQLHQLLLNRTAQMMDGLGYEETGKLILRSRRFNYSGLTVSSPFLQSVEAIFLHARGDLTLSYEQRRNWSNTSVLCCLCLQDLNSGVLHRILFGRHRSDTPAKFVCTVSVRCKTNYVKRRSK